MNAALEGCTVVNAGEDKLIVGDAKSVSRAITALREQGIDAEWVLFDGDDDAAMAIIKSQNQGRGHQDYGHKTSSISASIQD